MLRHHRRGGYSMVELLAAVAIFGALAAAVATSHRALADLHRRIYLQSSALAYLDNVVERLAVEGTQSVETVARDEWQRDRLSKDRRLRLLVTPAPTHTTLEVQRIDDERPAGRVAVPR